ncbi:DUF1972 domain-containing protein [Enterobacter sp. ENT03]|uniref:DUF1972 domain-containing protein n=1 Tax=Enterobacter sp. ENT03 TaxID=2854780 RepID=UPI001C4431E0|nr:DUF1972 domain-containing protein [Enterobacter sp. ENT03]
MKSVAVIGTVGIPSCYGGFESLVENLTLNKSDDIKYTVFCSSKAYKSKKRKHNGAHLIYLPLSANGVSSIFYDIISLIVCILKRPDAVLILGVSGCIFLPIFRFLSRSKIITNIDGLEWKREKWSLWQRKFLKFSESMAVKYSDIIISDNQAITDYVLSEYKVESKTIAYGGDHAIRNIDERNEKPYVDEPYSLGLCRIEPENNISLILNAFSQIENKLIFVGNWQSSDYGKQLREKYSSYSNIELLDPIYDLDKLYFLRKNCSFYIHGHSAGGTNPSLVEMMHFKHPIFAFDCNFNRFSTDNKAFYFKSSDELIKLLSVQDSSSLMANATSMHEIAAKVYTWENISKNYEALY